MTGIVDSHTHYFPRFISENPQAWADEMKEPHWLSCVAPSHGKSVQGWADLDQMLRDMDSAGIEKAVMLGWYWEQQATCEAHNRCYIEAVKRYPDRLMGFATANPLAGQSALDSLRYAVDQGLIGFGEFLPQVQGYTLQHEAWGKVVELAIELNVPINVHVTEPVGHHYAGYVDTPLRDYQRLAEQYPQCTFIFAHWGGLLPFFEMNKTVRKALKNVYYDTAASPLLYDKTIYKRVVDTVGAEKILFGTDYPLLLRPGQSRTPSFAPILEEINEAELPSEQKEALLQKNAQNLFS